MRKGAKLAAALAVAALAGCGGISGGGDGGTRGDDVGNGGGDFGVFAPRPDPLDVARAEAGEPLVDQVVSMSISPTPSGAIVSAVGLPPTQGFWDADLVRVPSDEASVLLLEFRLLPPLEPRPTGTQPSREVLAGAVFSLQDLAGISTIAVQAQRNRATSRR